jgi:hypothetical protein
MTDESKLDDDNLDDDDLNDDEAELAQHERTAAARGLLDRPAPPAIGDLAALCVRFVERAVGVRLDYTAETLPLLDHYLRHARATLAPHVAGEVPAEESREVVVQSAGAYLGEVIRRRHPAWWRLAADGREHRLEFHEAWVVVRPMSFVADAIRTDLEAQGTSLDGLDLDADDRPAVLPEVELDEFVAPSTRLEVIDIAVDAIRARYLADDGAAPALEPEDYAQVRR